MELKEDLNVIQEKLNSVVSTLLYEYFSHMNQAGINSVTIPNDNKSIKISDIGKTTCGTETLRGIIHGYQVAFNSQLISDDTVCDPKYIPCNCIMKDKNGYIQYGAGDELYLDYPINDTNASFWAEGMISNTSRSWRSVCYGNGKFVAVASYTNYFAYSTDGITWTESTISDTKRNWNSVCYGNDKFVAIPGGTNNTNYFAYSTDGITWTEGTISNTNRMWQPAYYGNDKFVTVAYDSNYFAYSTDGIKWTEGTISSTSRWWKSVCYGNDKFVTVAQNTNYFAYSTDGIKWTEGTISSTSRWWKSVCYGNDKFVAVASSNYFAYSTDGITWTESTISDTDRDWYSVCYGNGKFVTIGNNTFAYSTDGINWTEGTISSANRSWDYVCYGNGKFVAITSSNYFAYSTGMINYHYNQTINTYNSRYFITDPYDQYISDTKVKISSNYYLNQYLEIINSSSNVCVKLSNILNASQVLKDAATNGSIKFIYNKLKNSNSKNDYSIEQFFRYLVFDDSDGNHYIAVTSDLINYSTYKLNSANYSFAIKTGILFIYLPEKDSIAMITRHPITTDIIEIDGNDPENMSDYTKPYYRLIEIPFLKKYYKYSGKHATNVAIGIIGAISTSTSIFGSNRYLSDYTLLVNVFNKTYRIGIPNYNMDDIKTVSAKKLQEIYTSNEQTSDNLTNIKNVSQAMVYYDSSDTNLSCNINSRHFSIVTDSNLNITIDNMSRGYDFDTDETAPTLNKNISNYTFVGANSLTDLSTPTSVIYPNINY